MKEKEYCVYKHTCPNGKVYIGITCQNPLKRWANGNGYRGSRHFNRAIQKYGWDNIKHEILYTELTQREAQQKEVELIKKHRSTNPNFGYNITAGGDIGYIRTMLQNTEEEANYKIDYEYKIDWNFKLPTYEEIKEDGILQAAFQGMIELAKGSTYKETITKIWEENDVEIDRKIETKEYKIEPNKRVRDVLLRNYSEVEELKDLIEELKKIK